MSHWPCLNMHVRTGMQLIISVPVFFLGDLYKIGLRCVAELTAGETDGGEEQWASTSNLDPATSSRG